MASPASGSARPAGESAWAQSEVSVRSTHSGASWTVMTTATFFGEASGWGGGAATHVSGLTYVSKAEWVVGVEAQDLR